MHLPSSRGYPRFAKLWSFEMCGGHRKCFVGKTDGFPPNHLRLHQQHYVVKEFCGIVSYLEKVVCDSKQLVKVGSAQMTTKQLKQRIGVKPTLADCLEGIRLVEEMHQSEYLLKLSVVSALPSIALKPSASGDLGALHQLLVDQPNIPREEVQYIYDIIFAENIS
ncbi:uncharacterized protein At5g43822-like isoform X3 [Salvia miltiorrhiza]|uniref:uncharacterized protein At5g43822-like isoform X3 n=1 Tax=Salvia miltiorrhiza TaxID=226208 RepID=UPI0025AB7F5D|nr:uncharacterized protein At5g43822-like isoform X3 [Salvia miltiorrhiza]